MQEMFTQRKEEFRVTHISGVEEKNRRLQILVCELLQKNHEFASRSGSSPPRGIGIVSLVFLVKPSAQSVSRSSMAAGAFFPSNVGCIQV